MYIVDNNYLNNYHHRRCISRKPFVLLRDLLTYKRVLCATMDDLNLKIVWWTADGASVSRISDFENTLIRIRHKMKLITKVSILMWSTLCYNLKNLTAGAAYIRVFIFISTLSTTFFKMVKIKFDIYQQDLKRVDLHFVKSESFSLT